MGASCILQPSVVLLHPPWLTLTCINRYWTISLASFSYSNLSPVACCQSVSWCKAVTSCAVVIMENRRNGCDNQELSRASKQANQATHHATFGVAQVAMPSASYFHSTRLSQTVTQTRHPIHSLHNSTHPLLCSVMPALGLAVVLLLVLPLAVSDVAYASGSGTAAL